MKFKIKKLDKYYDPYGVYKLFSSYEDSIFLDSSKEDKVLSRYSFIGVNPISKFISKDNKCYIDNKEIETEDSFLELENFINKYKVEDYGDIPFVAGAIGYFSYDMGKRLEVEDTIEEVDVDIPDSIFIIYENIIIFDLINRITYISKLGLVENSIEKIEKILEEYKVIGDAKVNKSNTIFSSNFHKESYEEALLKLKDYIESGDVYIANMTRRITCESKEDSFKIYEKLRSINKAPFSAFANYKDFQIISSSPERFLSVKDRIVNTRPIKGTRPRGNTKEEDLKNKEELINSSKDKAELLMIVDLERNDLSKVCKPFSVKVKELFKIEEYATVFHLVADIEGELENGISSVKCIKECFPGGSITGAPKIRAMEIIEELEGIKRNIYTGAIGYFDFRGNCDFNIAIRTILKKDDRAYFGVGGGITWDSIKEAEWEETIDKAKALMRVL